LNRFKDAQTGQLPEQMSVNMVALERLNERLRINLDSQARIGRQDRAIAIAPDGDGIDPLRAAQQRLTELLSKYTDKHPDVIRLKSEIADMERQRALQPHAAQVKSAPISDPPELQALQAEERTLRSQIGDYEQRIQSTP